MIQQYLMKMMQKTKGHVVVLKAALILLLLDVQKSHVMHKDVVLLFADNIVLSLKKSKMNLTVAINVRKNLILVHV